jgi:hypothetical protein
VLLHIVKIVTRKRSELPMQRTTTTGWIVAGVIIAASAIVIFLLTDSWWELINDMLSAFVGLLIGSLLMHGAFRLLGWGESAARSVVIWTWVVGVALLVLVGFVAGGGAQEDEAGPHLGSVINGTAVGIVLGAGFRAVAIRKRLRTETTETEARP